jgi:hypothetical protein
MSKIEYRAPLPCWSKMKTIMPLYVAKFYFGHDSVGAVIGRC